jgi:hypothetical protein
LERLLETLPRETNLEALERDEFGCGDALDDLLGFK